MQVATRWTLSSALVQSSRIRHTLSSTIQRPATTILGRYNSAFWLPRAFSASREIRQSTADTNADDQHNTLNAHKGIGCREEAVAAAGTVRGNLGEGNEVPTPITTAATAPIEASTAEPVEAQQSQTTETVGPDDGGEDNVGDKTQQQPAKRGRPVGSKSRRLASGTKSKDSKPEIPQWFLDTGVVLKEQIRMQKPRLEIVSDQPPELLAVIPLTSTTELGLGKTEQAALEDIGKTADQAHTSPRNPISPDDASFVVDCCKDPIFTYQYQVHEAIWKEILTHIRAGLMLPKAAFTDSLASLKSHFLLHFPKEGGVYHLDAIVEKIASEVQADLVRIDPQDLEEIGGDLVGDSRYLSTSTISSHSIRSLGYDVQLTDFAKEEEDAEEFDENDESLEEEDWDSQNSFSAYHGTVVPPNLRNMLKSGVLAVVPLSSIVTPDGKQAVTQDQTNEKKISAILRAIVEAPALKRGTTSSHEFVDSQTLENSSEQISKLTQRTIIHIRDHGKLESIPQGGTLLRMLREIVSKKRRAGEPIIIIGTSTVRKYSSHMTKAVLSQIQSHPENSMERTIVVPPLVYGDNQVYIRDRESRVKEINVRHLKDIIRRRSGESKDSINLSVPPDWHLSASKDGLKIPGIAEKIWTFDKVHRVALTALGEYIANDRQTGELTLEDINLAVHALEFSDSIKWSWADKERKWLKEEEAREAEKEAEEAEKEAEESSDGSRKEKESAYAIRMRNLQKTTNTHEKSLLGGVIDPDKLHVSFSSVRASPETIEALKTLTSLSLIRPDAFKYGVLATERIPGILLYGPPGTGKTLLAKAVAKESGATVLEVSGSEIFDMYVGEGEKNVKAIFSLAEKLSPCVVFIDEADAIFGSRNSHSSRNTHREIINQFLKEWADFQMGSSAFIMVATNRPFDLDDAVLRRLPRRILVDLPTKQDREAILKIHLKNELLDTPVDLADLAAKTNLYSGSDLKNLCVAAALACVREETDNQKFHGTPIPDKRVLKVSHFTKAMGEIAASISDDMSSLMAIRKFDEKYGEKGGRLKRGSGWGFSGKAALVEKGKAEEGTGRVRRLAL